MRHFPLYLGWLAMLAVIYLLYPSGPDHSSPLSGIDSDLALMVLILVALAIVTKVVVVAIRDGSRPAPAASARIDTGAGGKAARTPDVGMIATGAFAGLFVVYVFALIWSALRPAWAAHAPAVVAAGLAAFAPRMAVRAGAGASQRQFTVALRWSAIFVCAGVAAWIWHSIGIVIAHAEAIAGGKPYCIQVAAGRDRYDAAAARLDFSPLTMRARCSQGYCWQNHAILVVADGDTPALWNWSYRKKDFFQDVLNARTKPPPVLCRPKPHFAQDLPLF
jgi:hypothetical protein